MLRESSTVEAICPYDAHHISEAEYKDKGVCYERLVQKREGM
jgi:hypothetical protein